MRRALIVGVNYYKHITALYGCVNDAYEVKSVLERHGDGSVNFDCEIIAVSSEAEQISRSDLKDKIAELYASKAEIALLYFSGHGHVEATGGYILTSEATRGDEGLSLADILVLANKSPVENKVIILDSCHSGIAGNNPQHAEIATLSEGITILTASTADQYATESDGQGIFTGLLVDALSGAGSNLVGQITPGSVYAHIDQSLGAWGQRPTFKTNVSSFVSLRNIVPHIDLDDLRAIPNYFPTAGYEFQLDPTYEPELKGRDEDMPNPIEEHTRIFDVLQKYNRLNLLKPVGVKHMWNAAMESKGCKLTALGEHYRQLVIKKRI